MIVLSDPADAEAAKRGGVNLDCGRAEAEHTAESRRRVRLAAVCRAVDGKSLVHLVKRILGALVGPAPAQRAPGAIGGEGNDADADRDAGDGGNGQRHWTLLFLGLLG